jgi:hypothetical protein
MTEFSDLLESLLAAKQNLQVVGDFNFLVNVPDNSEAKKLISLIDCANLHQHVAVPTHTNGHTLDLVITPTSSPLSVNISGTDHSVSSDHCAALFKLELPKPARQRKSVCVRKWKSIDVARFNQDIIVANTSTSLPSMDPITMYNNLLVDLLDKHAPSKDIKITERTETPWYTQEIRHAKTLCRTLERKWCRSNLTIDQEIFKRQRNQLTALRDNAKSEYIRGKLESSTSSKDTFAILNSLLHRTSNRPLPDHEEPRALADSFATFFSEKIELVRRGFDTPPTAHQDDGHTGSEIALLESFRLTQETEISKLISSSASKSCALDPIPTWLLKQCPSLVPQLCNIVNDSLSTGCVPSSLKQAHVIPVIKKASLNQNELKNYRPVSNLAYASKLVERVVSNRLEEHCAANNVNMYYQSAYKKPHSTESALMRVQNDLLKAVDSQGGAILVLLDLSAAFDTIDHAVLINTLRTEIGITGTALQWFQAYLSDRHQSVKIGSTFSSRRDLPYGVPQGSVLGPQLFSLYTQPLSKVIEVNGMTFHLYADDTQLYIAFRPKCASSISNTMDTIDICTSNISTWMKTHFLKLNNEKTEILVITTPSLTGHQITSLNICGSAVKVSDCVRDLGVHYDSTLRMDTHIKAVCKKAYYQIHLVHKVRNFISEDAARTLIQANVTSLLDYCNGLLIGLPTTQIDKLQRVQNAAARVIKRMTKSMHITPILKQLHWLPIRYRIQYKIIVLTYKALNDLAPPYLADLLHPYQPSRSLRSQNDNLLSTKAYRLKAYGGRWFEVVAPQMWNDLPPSMRKITSLLTFKKTLKTHLFIQAFE